MRVVTAFAWLVVVAPTGCSNSDRDPAPPAYASWPDPLESMPRGSEHTAAVCARDGDDPVRGVLCSGEAPEIASLAELQAAFRLDSDSLGGVTGISATAHSTALSSRSVSAINPRVIAMQPEVIEPAAGIALELITIAFTRGEQFCELMVRDRADHELRFYLVGFRQACNDSDQGCTPGDLLTPAIEKHWTEYTLYDEQDVTNTVLDCAPCHQPNGPGTPKLLRMQEFDPPWTHWLFNSNEGGQALLADYFSAKGDERYAGMTAEQMRAAHPGNLSMVAYHAGYIDQPNVFVSEQIEAEVKASAAASGGNQPVDNSIPGESATWRATYERAMRGDAISVPYHDVKVTDPIKLAAMTEAYQAFRNGEIERDELPDIRDVFPDDEGQLAAMSFMTEPGLDGKTVLLQACSQCHNERLDQRLSRAGFRADLVGMDRAARDRAIERLRLPARDRGAMPPALVRELSPEARRRAIAALEHE